MNNAYRLDGMLNGSQNIDSVQVHAKVCLLLLGQDLEDVPAGGAAVDAVVGEGLGEDDVHDLFPEKQLPALGILDDVGDGAGSGRPGLCVGALEVLQHWQDLALTELGELG